MHYKIKELHRLITTLKNEEGLSDYGVTLLEGYAVGLETVVKNCSIPAVINWVAFDFYKLETRPPKYGKYLITRKDGKIHWETWNGGGWAYNHNEIRYWAEIKPPCL